MSNKCVCQTQVLFDKCIGEKEKNANHTSTYFCWTLMLTLFLSAAASTQYDKLDKSRLVVVARPPPPPIDPGLEKLIEEYGAERNASCKAVLPKVPTIDAADAAAFMSAYQSFKGNTSEAPVFAAAQKLLTPSLDSFLSLPSRWACGCRSPAAQAVFHVLFTRSFRWILVLAMAGLTPRW